MSNQEIIRREQYCQIVSEITGSDEYMVVGMDVGKDKHHAFVGTARGICLFKKLVFDNNLDGFDRLLTTVDQLKSQSCLEKIVYGLEPTGNYHKPLARHLIRCGRNVVFVAGQAVKKNRELLDGRWDKNDGKDAANVADLVSRGKCLYYDCPSPQIDELRGLLSLRRRLKKQEHGLKMRIRNGLLAQYFPEMDEFYSSCESESLAIVKWCLDPDKISAMEFDTFFDMVTTGRRGIAQTRRLRHIHHLAVESIGCPMGPAAEYEAALLVEKRQQVAKQIQNTADLMEDICLELPEYRYLLTIPGFGPYISARVLASIGDPFRFDNRKQVIKMSGFDLSAIRTGKTAKKAVPVISKKGSGELRYALYQAASVAAGRTDLFRAYFTKILRGREREPGIRTKMRVKLAVKMLVIAWKLMKTKQSFDPDHINID
jgi:transposase